jgi:hypothetical protein
MPKQVQHDETKRPWIPAYAGMTALLNAERGMRIADLTAKLV